MLIAPALQNDAGSSCLQSDEEVAVILAPVCQFLPRLRLPLWERFFAFFAESGSGMSLLDWRNRDIFYDGRRLAWSLLYT
jgi:hypothetical protein